MERVTAKLPDESQPLDDIAASRVDVTLKDLDLNGAF
jgi:hypothetical protein